ncbi:MAG: hypothetical protein E4G94_08425 [ANME-2 cluster archaeon]|nr:MAG: hypothetical protein E4G94_08425 [ANME-2 cluster archaeon]
MNTSQKFYIGLTDTDLSVKAINFGKSSHYYVLGTTFYIVSEIWLKNKGTSSLNEVSVNWKIVREPSGVVEKQGNKIFKNLTPDTWYSQNIKVKYFDNSFTENHYLGGRLEPGEMFVLILNADIDNRLGEMELTRNDNTYRTEILYDTNY